MPSQLQPSPEAIATDRARKNRTALLIMVIIGIAFSIVPMMNTWTKAETNKDYSRWWRASMDVRNDRPLQDPGGAQSFIYPPASAVVFYTPLSFLGNRGMVLALCVLNIAAHITAVLLSVRFATGRSLNQHPLVYVVPVAVTLPYVWDTFYLGQPNLMLLAAMLVALGLLDKARARARVWAGAIFGAVVVAKAFPATVIGFLVWRRHWVAAVTMVLSVLVLLLVVPGPVRGFEANAKETWVWIDRMLLSTSGERLANQPGRAFKSGNQSMMSVVHRLTRSVETDPSGEVGLVVNVVDVSSRAAFVIFVVLAGAMCLAYVTGMPRRGERTRRSNGLEFAILLLLIPMFSPKAGTYFYCWVIPALAMVTAELLRAPRGSPRRRFLFVGLILAILVMASALTQVLDIFTPQSLGVTFWGAFILFVLLIVALHTHTRRVRGGMRDSDELGDLAPFQAA